MDPDAGSGTHADSLEVSGRFGTLASQLHPAVSCAAGGTCSYPVWWQLPPLASDRRPRWPPPLRVMLENENAVLGAGSLPAFPD